MQLMNTHLITGPEQGDEGEQAETSEPGGLIICGSDFEIECSAFFIPDARIVRGDHLEPVVSRTQITVKSLAPGLRILPLPVVAFQFVSKLHLLRSDKAQSRIVNLEISRQGWETEAALY